MIQVEHLTKVYGTTTALRDVSFSATSGEILGLLGPNGAGKTTTMRILAGYLPATSGTASIAGYEVHTDPMAVRQRIGYLPENPPLYTEMTVAGYLHFVARIKGVSAGDRPQRVEYALKSCGLWDQQRTIIRKLSKGYRQRVGIAQAIVHDPPAIILDEPTVGLDPRQIIEVRNLIKNLAGQHTVILSTHILAEVSMTCDRAVIIHKGEVAGIGQLDELLQRLSSSYTYDLELVGDRPHLESLLQQLPDLQQITWGNSPRQGRQQLQVSSPSEIGADLASLLVQNGVQLFEMRRSRANLEEVFLKLTTDEPTAEPSDTTEEAHA
ncbi:ABC transporter ATP-binding protein [Thermosynechococcus vestitus]|uniref:ABC transporter ATP-binding protein n=1 Tax=Thermosynechococcus vestitus (strain NIES-2133 / IAM M-273 / BP-1) TaxID=197221 RepID=Q8DIV8_THEVB|nr:ABC transporter ATP-binding protein [Thermosynechococcus vestitus]BAC09025.1 ABC transporter ATP-binding protein [Thermosynechococcus vestitus BP-1]BAY52213.1 ABC transporter ATP-binding protein [Thermostichus vulcanus NIES-2134]